MAKLKYKDKDGFWQELPVGTNVVANPTLTGTEQELTSLQVGNAKYKSGGGKLYRHSLIFTTNYYITGYIYSSRETPFTFDEIKTNAPAYIFVYFEGGGKYIGVLHLTSNLTESFLMGVSITETPGSVQIHDLTGKIEFRADNVTEV